MKIIQKIATGSECYRAGRKITPKGLMLHSVGCNQPDPHIFAKRWMTSDNVCPHGVIGSDGTVIQTLPWTHRGWHGGGDCNDTHIGIELCEPKTLDYSSGGRFVDKNPKETKAFLQRTYKTAVELFAHLCKEFKLDPLADGVIISHSEGWKRGIASNHGDVEHIWDKYGLSMDKFRLDVKAAMQEESTAEDAPVVTAPAEEQLYRVRKSWDDVDSQEGAYKVLDNAKKKCDELAKLGGKYKVYDSKGNAVYPAEPAESEEYLVKVTVDALNVRDGAGTNYDINYVIRDRGYYTIVETVGTWGKLKSGLGWISLNYTARV